MKIIFILICILVAVFILFLLVGQKPVKVLPHEEAKAVCYEYCEMGCRLNSTIDEMKKIWEIEVVDETLGRITCGKLVGNCICT